MHILKNLYFFLKLLANSIYYNFLIGIEFCPPFWKSILGKQLEAEDLEYVEEENTYKNYVYLKNVGKYKKKITVFLLAFIL